MMTKEQINAIFGTKPKGLEWMRPSFTWSMLGR